MALRALKPVRPAEAGDRDAINSLLQAAGFPKRSRRGFDWLLRDNPGQGEVPGGWVAEDNNDTVCAFLGNFVQRAWLNGRPCLTSSAHSFVTARGQPSRALRLLRHFVNQDGAVLLNGLNASPDSAWIYEVLGYPSYPDTGNLRLSWVTDAAAVTRLAHRLRSRLPVLDALAPYIPEPRRRWPAVGDAIAASGEDTGQIVVPIGNARLAAFDAELRSGPRLFTERSPEALHWRVSDPDARVPPVLVAHPAEGPIRGLALFQFNKPSRIEPPCLDVIDLVTLDPKDRAAVQALLQTGLHLAKEGGAARLRLNLVTPALLALIGPLNDSAEKEVGETPHAFYRFNVDMPEPLTRYWQPLPYDADHGLVLRPMPVRA